MSRPTDALELGLITLLILIGLADLTVLNMVLAPRYAREQAALVQPAEPAAEPQPAEPAAEPQPE